MGGFRCSKKGTLSAMDEWVRMHFRLSDWTQWDESIEALRHVRKLRQRPAHGLDDDKFDQQYFRDQRELMIRYTPRSARFALSCNATQRLRASDRYIGVVARWHDLDAMIPLATAFVVSRNPASCPAGRFHTGRSLPQGASVTST